MPDPTRVEGADDSSSGADSTTAEAPARWSGAAPVPAAQSKKARRSRRRLSDDDQEWELTPPVDPWAEQDTPWSPMAPPPGVMMPPTRIDAPAMPPTLRDAPVAPAPEVKRVPGQTRPPAYAPPPPPWKPAGAAPPAAPVAPPGPPPLPPRPSKASTKAPTKTQLKKPGSTATRPPAGFADRPPTGRPPAGPDGRPLPGPAGSRPRRRQRRMRGLLLLVLIGGGAIAYFAWPPARQYPVSASLPGQVADLSLSDSTGDAGQAADRLSQQVEGGLGGQKPFAGVYADGSGKRVTIFGTTGLRLTPGQDVTAELDHLTGDYHLTEVQSFSLGELGAHEQCGVGRDDGTGVVVCAWADHGSLATVMMTRRNVADSAALTSRLRTAVLTHG